MDRFFHSAFYCFALIMLILSFSVNISYSSGINKSIKFLQDIVDNPQKARSIRDNIKNKNHKYKQELIEIQKIIRSTVNEITMNLPMQIDSYTQYDSVVLIGNKILNKYTLYGVDDILYRDDFLEDQGKILTNAICTSPGGAFTVFGYSFQYSYYLEDGRSF